jgi:hypothetical protein
MSATMDDMDQEPRDDVAASNSGRRGRGSLVARTAVATVVAGGLAAGSYGIASAASANGSTRQSTSKMLAAASKSGKSTTPKAGHPRFPTSPGPGRFGRGGGFGRGGFGPGGFGLPGIGGPPGIGIGPGAGFGQGGTVKAVTPTTITVTSLSGSTITVTTNASTTYREGGSKVARSAVTVGEQVAFVPLFHPGGSSSKAAGSKSSDVVAGVEIVQPQAYGKVVKVSGSQLVIAGRGGLNVTVNTSSHTTYSEAGDTVPAADIQVGTVVLATGSLSSSHDQIDALKVQIVPAAVTGQVTAVSGTTITVRSFGGTTETVTTSSKTIFTKPGGKATFASVAKGDFVEAFGTAGAGKTFAALTVVVRPAVPSGTGGLWGFAGRGGRGGPARGFGGPKAPSGPSGSTPAFSGQVGGGLTTA